MPFVEIKYKKLDFDYKKIEESFRKKAGAELDVSTVDFCIEFKEISSLDSIAADIQIIIEAHNSENRINLLDDIPTRIEDYLIQIMKSENIRVFLKLVPIGFNQKKG